jgi:hypothetical protein
MSARPTFAQVWIDFQRQCLAGLGLNHAMLALARTMFYAGAMAYIEEVRAAVRENFGKEPENAVQATQARATELATEVIDDIGIQKKPTVH